MGDGRCDSARSLDFIFFSKFFDTTKTLNANTAQERMARMFQELFAPCADSRNTRLENPGFV